MKEHSVQMDRQQNNQNDKPELSKHNRVRLIQQNRRLMAELMKLSHIISTVIQNNASSQFSIIEEGEGVKIKYQREKSGQMREIKAFKSHIKSIKANLQDHRIQDVKHEENQVSFLKKEYQKLMIERQTLGKKRAEKEEALEHYKPLNNLLASTFERYRKTKSENAELKLIINQKQKEVNRYHKIKQLARNAVRKDYQNPGYEFVKMENEILTMKKEIKRIEDKWKSKVESFDTQFFGFKSIMTDKEMTIDILERQAKNWEYKSGNYRDQTAVASDRQRVRSIAISPQKRKQMQEMLEESKRRGKRLEVKEVQAKPKKEKNKPQTIKSFVIQTSQSEQLPLIKEQPTEKQHQKILEKRLVNTGGIVESEKEVVKQKPTKMMESVGVGTSFYYAED